MATSGKVLCDYNSEKRDANEAAEWLETVVVDTATVQIRCTMIVVTDILSSVAICICCSFESDVHDSVAYTDSQLHMPTHNCIDSLTVA